MKNTSKVRHIRAVLNKTLGVWYKQERRDSMKKLFSLPVLFVVVMAFATTICLHFATVNAMDSTPEIALLDFEDSGEPEFIHLDFEDSGEPEFIHLDFEDSGEPEFIHLDFEDSGEPEFIHF